MAAAVAGPIVLFTDFDSTLTTHSTLDVIAGMKGREDRFAALTASYLDDLQSWEGEYAPTRADSTTLEQTLVYLDAGRFVEKRSIERINRDGIFAGVCHGEAFHYGRACVLDGRVCLRDGWLQAARLVCLRGGCFVVLSVAWSAEFIRGCLAAALEAFDAKVDGGAMAGLRRMEVFANEIDTVKGGIGGCHATGQEDGMVLVAGDKLAVMKSVLDEFTLKLRLDSEVTREMVEQGRGGGVFTVYMGDAPADLACLVEAHLGICVRDQVLSGEQRALKEMCGRAGLTTADLAEWTAQQTDETRRLWVGGFEELLAWLTTGMADAC